ncbi:hypothetical protein VNI00_011949 [Paramarasmius palmivorus]|uniref:Uncharacterized protein n=1 Tax=Paramarasmius palmivorus TaxID=297713 RepID=A0AAW0C945_9AGAR
MSDLFTERDLVKRRIYGTERNETMESFALSSPLKPPPSKLISQALPGRNVAMMSHSQRPNENVHEFSRISRSTQLPFPRDTPTRTHLPAQNPVMNPQFRLVKLMIMKITPANAVYSYLKQVSQRIRQEMVDSSKVEDEPDKTGSEMEDMDDHEEEHGEESDEPMPSTTEDRQSIKR